MDSRKIRLLLNSVLIIAFLVVFRDFVVYRKKSVTYQQQIADLNIQIEALRREESALREKVSRLESDPATIERMARDRLNMMKPGEEVIPPDTLLPAPSAARAPSRR